MSISMKFIKNYRDYDERLRNVQVFNDTVRQSKERYFDDTFTLQQATKVYSEPSEIDIDIYEKFDKSNVKITYGGTVSTAYRYVQEGYKVAMLNFADAITPGGLVLGGEVTQEENICRCTNLYESLTTFNATMNYYKKNKEKLSEFPYYTNALIYSPDVLIFKDDTIYTDLVPHYVDVITCPSPQGGDTKRLSDIIKKRITGIIKSAIVHDIDVLVLGAWGCGAFAQDPAVMARLFAEVLLDYDRYFKVIDFAIRSNDGSKSALSQVFEDNLLAVLRSDYDEQR